MIIDIDPDFRARLREPENFRGFHVELAADKSALGTVRAKLPDLAEWSDDQHAWIAVSALRDLPGAPTDPAWASGLETMIEKARPHGWIRERPVLAIKAHLVWRED